MFSLKLTGSAARQLGTWCGVRKVDVIPETLPTLGKSGQSSPLAPAPEAEVETEDREQFEFLPFLKRQFSKFVDLSTLQFLEVGKAKDFQKTVDKKNSKEYDKVETACGVETHKAKGKESIDKFTDIFEITANRQVISYLETEKGDKAVVTATASGDGVTVDGAEGGELASLEIPAGEDTHLEDEEEDISSEVVTENGNVVHIEEEADEEHFDTPSRNATRDDDRFESRKAMEDDDATPMEATLSSLEEHSEK